MEDDKKDVLPIPNEDLLLEEEEKRSHPWSSYRSYTEYIKLLYASDPRNWTKDLNQLCKENGLNPANARVAISRYGTEKFKQELQELKTQYIKQVIDQIAQRMLDATKLSLEHIYNELANDGDKKWKAMWHLREFIKAFQTSPIRFNSGNTVRYEKVIISSTNKKPELTTEYGEEENGGSEGS